MLAIERRQTILNMIRKRGSVTIAELISLFDTTGETVRKDLIELEKAGLLKRIHGGAVDANGYSPLQPLSVRKEMRVKEKAELCRYAIRYIRNGDTVAIDEGSTANELAKLIVCSFSKLTVVTHDLDVFQTLSQNSGISLILCGGRFVREEKAFSGTVAAQTAGEFHTDTAFICPSGISLTGGVTDYGEDFIPVQKNYVRNTDRVIVLADSEKLEQSASFKICEISSDVTVITDSGLPDSVFAKYQSNGLTLIRGGTHGDR